MLYNTFTTSIPKSTLHDILKLADINRETNTLNPILNNKNSLVGVKWALSFNNRRALQFHLNKKWFQMSKKKCAYHLPKNQNRPNAKTKFFEHIPKVMFVAAVARPSFYVGGYCTFDEKIGI